MRRGIVYIDENYAEFGNINVDPENIKILYEGQLVWGQSYEALKANLGFDYLKGFYVIGKDVNQFNFPFGRDAFPYNLDNHTYNTKFAEHLFKNKQNINNFIDFKFINELPKVKTLLIKDIEAIYEGDPAAKCHEEVLICYPGFYAISIYRIAHVLYELKVPLIPRIMTEYAHEKTGVDIHAGATIGEYFFIDHGTGIVIGETTTIGNRVKIYQGVTLGGTGKDVGKRHPTLGNNVMIGAGAKVLGPIVIDSNSKIAANAVVLKDIPQNSTAVGIPAKVVRREGVKVESDLDQIHIPDPVAQELARIEKKLDEHMADGE